MPRLDELRVAAGSVTLAGTLTLPDSPPPDGRRGRYPDVLLLPSWLPRSRDGGYDRIAHPTWFEAEAAGDRRGLLARLADALADHGVASLRCDGRGSGASDGVWETTDLFTRIDDARDQLAAMRSRADLDLRRTGIIGHGEGAAVALAVAIADPAVSALTLIGASARSWRDVLRRAAALRARHAGKPGERSERRHPIVAAIDRWAEDLIERADRRERTFRLRLRGGEMIELALAGIEQAIHTPPMALASMLDRSVSVVHGSGDQWSDPAEAQLLWDALPSAAASGQIRVLDAGHDLAEAGREAIGEIAADLAARIQSRELPPVLLAIESMS